MPDYCMNRNPQRNQDGEHEVHNLGAGLKQGCLPQKENQIPLGMHENCERAVEHARASYPNLLIDGCEHCIPRCHRI